MASSGVPTASFRARLRGAALFGSVALLALGCAGRSAESGGSAKEKSSKTAKTRLPKSQGNCISPSSVTSFRVLDRTRILVNSYPARVIEVYEACDGVRFMEELTFAGTGGIVCDYRSDALIVDGQRCPIASIGDYEADADANTRKEIEGVDPDGKKKPSKRKPKAEEPDDD
jgi:hypothetical protein